MEELIDIIIPIYSRTIHTEKCLESIKNFTKNYNLILIEKMNSAAQNINEGLKQVKSGWFVIMDDDIIVSPGWLETLKMYREPSIGQIQPKMLMPFNGRIWSADVSLSPLAQKGFMGLDKEEYNEVKEAEMLTGGCGLYNSEILKKGIKQDQNFKGSQYNDIDFSLQIKKAGFKLLYCGKVPVIHHHLFKQSQNSTNNAYLKGKWQDIFPIKEFNKSPIIGDIEG